MLGHEDPCPALIFLKIHAGAWIFMKIHAGAWIVMEIHTGHSAAKPSPRCLSSESGIPESGGLIKH